MKRVGQLVLLSRIASGTLGDVFLARRASADGWVVKPLDAIRLRKAIRSLLQGGSYMDDSYRPPDVTVAAPS